MFVLPLSRSASLTRSATRSPSFDRFIDRLFDESIDRLAGSAAAASNARTPAMDVSESDGAYTITFDVPGATRDELKVSVEGRRVALTTVPAAADAPADKAAAPAADAKSVDRPLYRERTAAVYARTISLPAEVDQQASQAKFENGVLTLVLAKKVATGATQLQIV
jgi:HSP20 family protein